MKINIFQMDLKTHNTNIMCLLEMMNKQPKTKFNGISKRLDKMERRDSVHVRVLAKLMNLLPKIREQASCDCWNIYATDQSHRAIFEVVKTVKRDRLWGPASYVMSTQRKSEAQMSWANEENILEFFVKIVKDTTIDNQYDRAVVLLGWLL